MTDLTIAEHIRNVLVKSNELTEEEIEALDIAQMTFDPRCGNCKYHEYTKTLTGKKDNYAMFKCKNLSSPYRMTYTKDFITCNCWERYPYKKEKRREKKEETVYEN